MILNEKLSKDEIRVAGKFILLQLAGLVTDAVGHPKYVANLDHVIEDLYGYKKLATKISACRNDTMMIAVVLDFGFRDLFKLTNDGRTMEVLADLVGMDRSLTILHKELKKGSKKGSNSIKKRRKEYNYISDLYKQTIKTLRKDLGLSAKNPYKNQFRAARDFLEMDSESSFFDDSGYGRSIYVTDDDDDDEESLFSQFVSERVKKPKRSTGTNPNPHMFVRSKEDGFEHLLEQYDDDEDDDEPRATRSNIPPTVRLETKLDHLTSAVQQLISVGMTKPVIPTVIPQVPSNVSGDIAAYLTSVSKNEAAILDAIDKLSRKVTDNDHRFDTLASAVHEIVSLINDEDDDEDADDEDYPYSAENPQEYQNVLQRRQELLREKFCRKPQPPEYEPGERPLTKAEVADIMFRAETQPVVDFSDRTPVQQMNRVTTTIPTTPPPVQKTDESPAAVFNQTIETRVEVVEQAPISHVASDEQMAQDETVESTDPVAAEPESES